MVSEGVDIRRLRTLVYATNVLTELSFRQIVGRVVRSDSSNKPNDSAAVYMPADPRLVDFASRITGTTNVQLPKPIIIDDPDRDKTIKIIDTDDTKDGEFQPLASEGNVKMVTDVTGRQVPSHILELAQRYVENTDSSLPAFELAVLAWTDETLLDKLR